MGTGAWQRGVPDPRSEGGGQKQKAGGRRPGAVGRSESPLVWGTDIWGRYSESGTILGK